MAANRKREIRVSIEGIVTSMAREAKIGQAIMNVLHHHLDGETDGVTITFTEAEEF